MAAKVTADNRKSSGFSDGSYPVSSVSQCMSAIKLRGHSKAHSASEVLSHVARAKCASDPKVKAALAAAREAK
jgi:hypothetical protein